MKHVKPLVYDFYANAILNEIEYFSTREEVVEFYQECILLGILDSKSISVLELKRRLEGFDDFRLDTILEELDKTVN